MCSRHLVCKFYSILKACRSLGISLSQGASNSAERSRCCKAAELDSSCLDSGAQVPSPTPPPCTLLKVDGQGNCDNTDASISEESHKAISHIQSDPPVLLNPQASKDATHSNIYRLSFVRFEVVHKTPHKSLPHLLPNTLSLLLQSTRERQLPKEKIYSLSPHRHPEPSTTGYF